MKQRRIKKLVKGHLNAKAVDGQDVYADKKARLAALEQMDSATLLDTLIGAGVNKGDGDAATFANDFAPFDARETADTDGDGKGDNKEIHDAAALIDTKATTLTNLFTVDINSHTMTPGGVVDLAVKAAEDEVGGAGLTDGTYEAAEAAMGALNELIDQFDAGAAEVSSLWDSIKDLVPTANVSYDAKDVTVSHAEAEANFLNITNGPGAVNGLDIDAEKVLRDALQGRFDALVDPDPNT